jgi:hypothetical protein
MEAGLEINADYVYIAVSSPECRETHDMNILVVNRPFENMAQLKYLGATVTNQNLIQEKIKMRLNSDNACYYSVQNLLSSYLLSKNVKNRIYQTIIFHMVLSRVG